MAKTCTECSQSKPLTAFHRNGNGRHTKCAVCRLVYRKRQHPGRPRAMDLRNKYGLSVCQYLTIAKHQDSLCAICREAKTLYVDHDHQTGRVRGLICVTCNVLAGADAQHAELLRRALQYVESC